MHPGRTGSLIFSIIFVPLSRNIIYMYMEKQETYNEAVEKLRVIVDEIERGELDVDVLSEKVKEAMRLIKLCKDKLFKTDEEVKKILEELDS
jgi:exodeoxyribonuclease VII small subunit